MSLEDFELDTASYFANSDSPGRPDTPEVQDQGSGDFLSRYGAVSAPELLEMQFPQRQALLGQWLEDRSLAMVYGTRGVGKSFLALSIAIAVAGGKDLLGWKPGNPCSVLYVDGEMVGDHLQQRVKLLATPPTDTLPLHFLARDLTEDSCFNLSDDDFRRAIERHADALDAKLIVLDNLSTLLGGQRKRSRLLGHNASLVDRPSQERQISNHCSPRRQEWSAARHQSKGRLFGHCAGVEAF